MSSNGCELSSRKLILVNDTPFHHELELLLWISQNSEIHEGIAVNDQQIGVSTGSHRTQLAFLHKEVGIYYCGGAKDVECGVQFTAKHEFPDLRFLRFRPHKSVPRAIGTWHRFAQE